MGKVVFSYSMFLIQHHNNFFYRWRSTHQAQDRSQRSAFPASFLLIHRVLEVECDTHLDLREGWQGLPGNPEEQPVLYTARAPFQALAYFHSVHHFGLLSGFSANLHAPYRLFFYTHSRLLFVCSLDMETGGL